MTHLYCGFGHPGQSYKDLLLHIETSKQNQTERHQNTDQQTHTQSGDTQTYTHTQNKSVCNLQLFQVNI